MAALEDILDKDFFRRFLIEQKHTNVDLVTEIKTRYPNLRAVVYEVLKGWITKKSVKECRFQDGVLDVAASVSVSMLLTEKKRRKRSLNSFSKFHMKTKNENES